MQQDGEALYDAAMDVMESDPDMPREIIKQWLTSASQKGHIRAAHRLGSMCEEDQDHVQALKYYQIAARAGHACACFDVGICCFIGIGEGTPRAAFGWFLCAAYEEHPRGQFAVGWCYETGHGITNNHERALYWYEKAAKNHDPHGRIALARFYIDGEHTSQNHTKGFALLLASAEEQLPIAEYGVGLCYDFGYGVEVNPTVAVAWYTRAANQGLVDAQYNLGICYKYGTGVDRSTHLALQWFHRAALQGDVQAREHILEMNGQHFRPK